MYASCRCVYALSWIRHNNMSFAIVVCGTICVRTFHSYDSGLCPTTPGLCRCVRQWNIPLCVKPWNIGRKWARYTIYPIHKMRQLRFGITTKQLHLDDTTRVCNQATSLALALLMTRLAAPFPICADETSDANFRNQNYLKTIQNRFCFWFWSRHPRKPSFFYDSSFRTMKNVWTKMEVRLNDKNKWKKYRNFLLHSIQLELYTWKCAYDIEAWSAIFLIEDYRFWRTDISPSFADCNKRSSQPLVVSY